MKYQKSMLKIMDVLFENPYEAKSIEQIIFESNSGRNSSFSAISWLEGNGFVNIQKIGNQKLVKLNLDNYTAQFKYYFDSVKFKILNPFVKLIVKFFVLNISKISGKVDFVVLFGSSMNNKSFNDIDLLLVGKNLIDDDFSVFMPFREKIERVFGVILNLHKGDLNFQDLQKGLVVYQSSFINFDNLIEKQYFEYFDWFFEVLKNKKDKNAFDNAVINLAYCYSYLNNFLPKTKGEAVDFFNKSYKVKNIDSLRKRGVEIGEKIFR